MEPEDRRGCGEHHGDAEHQARDGAAENRLDDCPPEAALDRVGAAEVAAEERDPQRVDPVAKQREQRRQQRERRGDRDDADDDRAGGEAAHDRGRDEQHPEQRDDEGGATEEHRTARGRPGGADRCLLGQAAQPLLAVARDHKQRVVDPERQAHPAEHVHDEDREAELEREQRDDPEADEDREHRHQQRHEPGDDRAEDEHQHDDRGRQPELELSVLEVALGERAEVVIDGVARR